MTGAPDEGSFSFALFQQFPPEIQLQVLYQCNQNDLVCLALASRSLRYLASPFLPSKPMLSSVDIQGEIYHPVPRLFSVSLTD